MTTIREGRLELEFDETWLVVKWDDDPAFREGICKLCGEIRDGETVRHEGTKAVDLIGLRESVLYLIELKDFRGHRIENKSRQVAELPLEIGLKVRDSLAGLIGARHRSADPDGALVAFAEAMLHHPPRVVALIAEDARAPVHPSKQAAIRKERKDNLARRVHWLKTKVTVEDPFNHRLPGLVVRSHAEA